jgi:nucleoside 2-deoxyribosyltransferase
MRSSSPFHPGGFAPHRGLARSPPGKMTEPKPPANPKEKMEEIAAVAKQALQSIQRALDDINDFGSDHDPGTATLG